MTDVLEAPSTSTPSPSPTRRRFRVPYLAHRHARTWAYVVPLLALTAVATRLGMLGSPQRIDDEGTYTAQAYAVAKLGELTHYTYWYDHPPLGWIQIAGWTVLTDGFGRYQNAVMAGREAMVVAHVVAAGLLWLLARRLRLSRPASGAAVVIFALSPVAVQFSRTVYLDNVAVPWTLAAFVLALSTRRQLLSFTGSALCFGVAVLSKETFLLLLPFLAWQMWRSADRETRRYTLSVAASLLTLVLGAYGLFAMVKGEVLPGRGRVSLWDGIAFQLVDRGASGNVLDPASQAGRSVGVWLTLDPVLPVAAVAAALVAVFVRRLRPVAVAFLFLVAVIFKPGYLPVPFVIALIPFAALLVAAVADLGVRRGGRWLTALSALAGLVLVTVAAPLWAVQLRGLFLADLDRPLRQAQSWITSNVPKTDRILVDDSVWVDLVKAGYPRRDVVWTYKADTDPAVEALAPNGWRDYDYLLVTQATRRMINTAPTVREALANADRTAVFGSGDQEVDVYRIDPQGKQALTEAGRRDQQGRTAAGKDLLANPRITFSTSARTLLEQGQVDSRVISVLALLAGEQPVTVTGFPAVFGEAGQMPRRTIDLSHIDGDGLSTDAGTRLVAAARGQVGSFAPSEVRRHGDHLLLRYPVTGPVDLLPDPTP